MSFNSEKARLKQHYNNKRKWTQATQNYGFWTYPKEYYDELITIVLKHCK